MQPPIAHTFQIDGETFTLTEPNHAAERQIQVQYAQLVAPVPGMLDWLFADELLAEATAAVCLTEAPAWCWKAVPPGPSVNGTPTRVFDIGQSHRTFWPKLRAEVDVFRGLLRGDAAAVAGDVAATGPAPAEPPPVAPAETVSPVFRGQAV